MENEELRIENGEWRIYVKEVKNKESK